MQQKITVSKEVSDGTYDLKIQAIYQVKEDVIAYLVAVAMVTNKGGFGITAFTEVQDTVTIDISQELPVLRIIAETNDQLNDAYKKYQNATPLYHFKDGNQKNENIKEQKTRENDIKQRSQSKHVLFTPAQREDSAQKRPRNSCARVFTCLGFR